MSSKMTKVFKDKFLLVCLTSYLILTLPFVNLIPYLDGNIDFVKTYDFFSGGFTKLFQKMRRNSKKKVLNQE